MANQFRYQVIFGEDCDVHYITSNLGMARSFVDALYAIKHRAPDYFIAEETFPEIARNYREKPVKPILPEEARKYKVLAEFAIEQKRFDDAANAYAEALMIAPWWAEGRFNRAVILSNLSVYDEAAGEMKKYLQLEPDAQDARTAQDNIYKWESMAGSKKEESLLPDQTMKNKANKMKR